MIELSLEFRGTTKLATQVQVVKINCIPGQLLPNDGRDAITCHLAWNRYIVAHIIPTWHVMHLLDDSILRSTSLVTQLCDAVVAAPFIVGICRKHDLHLYYCVAPFGVITNINLIIAAIIAIACAFHFFRIWGQSIETAAGSLAIRCYQRRNYRLIYLLLPRNSCRSMNSFRW